MRIELRRILRKMKKCVRSSDGIEETLTLVQKYAEDVYEKIAKFYDTILEINKIMMGKILNDKHFNYAKSIYKNEEGKLVPYYVHHQGYYEIDDEYFDYKNNCREKVVFKFYPFNGDFVPCNDNLFWNHKTNPIYELIRNRIDIMGIEPDKLKIKKLSKTIIENYDDLEKCIPLYLYKSLPKYYFEGFNSKGWGRNKNNSIEMTVFNIRKFNLGEETEIARIEEKKGNISKITSFLAKKENEKLVCRLIVKEEKF